MYFFVDEFEVGVNDCIFSGNEQQKVYTLVLVRPFSTFRLVILLNLRPLVHWHGSGGWLEVALTKAHHFVTVF